MTPEEKHLWYDFLKKLPIPVKRQYAIEGYILDFYIPQRKLAIEIDGKQHSEGEIFLKDEKRDQDLASWEINVLRIPNEYVNKRFPAVTEMLLQALDLTWDDIDRKNEP